MRVTDDRDWGWKKGGWDVQAMTLDKLYDDGDSNSVHLSDAMMQYIAVPVSPLI